MHFKSPEVFSSPCKTCLYLGYTTYTHNDCTFFYDVWDCFHSVIKCPKRKMLYFWDKEILIVVFSTLKFLQNVHNHLTNYTMSQKNINSQCHGSLKLWSSKEALDIQNDLHKWLTCDNSSDNSGNSTEPTTQMRCMVCAKQGRKKDTRVCFLQHGGRLWLVV